MINILKEAWSLYVSKFKTILKIMLPAVLIGIPATAYLETTLGLDSGTPVIPSNISIIISLFFVLLLFLMVLVVSQLALAEALKNEKRKSFNLFKTVKFLAKLFWFRHFFLFFVIFLITNAPMGMFLKPQIENILLKQAMFNIFDFLLLLPLFHLYGFCLYRKKYQLQSSAKNS